MNQLDVKKQVNHVYSIANTLRGTYQADKYKDVIIPMTIIRRLECALADTKDEVCEFYEHAPDTPPQVISDISKYPFYNTSRYTLETLLAQPADLAVNLKTYLSAFSQNIRMILDKNEGLDFYSQIDKMDRGSRLTGVVRKFSELDLDPKRINNVAMGYMFEELIRRFSENTEAGDHYTPREVVRLLVRLGLAEGNPDLYDPEKVINVADVACGTGGMLSVANEELTRLCPEANVYLYGQEINPESHAICLADMLIKNQEADNIRLADTMKEDCFPKVKMRLQFVNPPFGQPWAGRDAASGVERSVRVEHSLSPENSRFPAGLPASGDMQLLFMQHIVHKMEKDKGRACVISNGSPLFSGGTASGESQVRRWLLENDYIEAIIGLPGSLFYNTDISIYVWVLSKGKRPARKGKVQLIDATALWTPMRRSLGKKRRFISDDQIAEIVDIYRSFQETCRCKIIDANEFIFHEYAVYQPLQRNYRITKERIDKLAEGRFSTSMHNPAKLEPLRALDRADLTAGQRASLDRLEKAEAVFQRMLDTLRQNIGEETWQTEHEFIEHLQQILSDLPHYRARQTPAHTRAMLKKVADRLSVIDKSVPLQHDRNGRVILDPATKDTEIVKNTQDVADYMETQVRPYVPDAVLVDEETDKAIKTGAEIPFTRYFYEYQEPESSKALLDRLYALELELTETLEDLRWLQE